MRTNKETGSFSCCRKDQTRRSEREDATGTRGSFTDPNSRNPCRGVQRSMPAMIEPVRSIPGLTTDHDRALEALEKTSRTTDPRDEDGAGTSESVQN